MSVISVFNPKGGAGRSTTALILGSVLASGGATASIIECDPNRPIERWAEGPSQSRLKVLSGITEQSIVSAINAERATHQIVIADLERTVSRMALLGISHSDLVIIPLQASPLDVDQAMKAIGAVRDEEKNLGRTIPLRIVITRANPATRSKYEKCLIEELKNAEIPMFKTHLNKRTAFDKMLKYRAALDELNISLVHGIESVITNANNFTEEVLAIITSLERRAVA